MCSSRRGVQCIIALANATSDEEAGVARPPDGIPLAVVSCLRRRGGIQVETAPETREFPCGECRSCIVVDSSRSRQTGDPGDVPAAHGGADSRQADVLLRAPRRHGHGHRGRGATFLHVLSRSRHAGIPLFLPCLSSISQL